MKFISHRGNISMQNPARENCPNYIQEAIDSGFDVEIDIWVTNQEVFLGHDCPTYRVGREFILEKMDHAWYHAKNFDALTYLQSLHSAHPSIKFFWHQKDDFTITSNLKIWTYPGKVLGTNSICVMPELTNITISHIKDCYGICSDNIEYYKKTMVKND